ncbi:NAD-dependent protein deacetylase [Alkalilimnicola ehrlichii]|uniref:NAD-dependent protein deacetylase n=1 Tax=Alkalilimnicola ehrlichii TaxID=351052 RepID=UPI002161EC2D|nr:NAD-dependent protein deacetylase [Alkalilimnicola ehrlichii]
MAVEANELVRLSRSIERLQAFVRAHPRLLLITGAGCSTDSGIPDYRDGDGRWKRKQPIQFQDFLRSESSRRRYWARSLVGWPAMAAAAPNRIHRTVAAMEQAGQAWWTVTQNVDGLHQRAGSRKVTDLHGRLDSVTCLSCGARKARCLFQTELLDLNPAWRDADVAATPVPIAPDGDADLERADFDRFEIPCCERCGGVWKPDVVFFGENVPKPRVADVFAKLHEVDAVLVLGSSLMVWSSFRFVRAAVEAGQPVAAVNLGRTRADAALSLKVEAPAAEVLPCLVEQPA